MLNLFKIVVAACALLPCVTAFHPPRQRSGLRIRPLSLKAALKDVIDNAAVRRSTTSTPTSCQFLLEKTDINTNNPFTKHGEVPRVVYLADKHLEYGTLGFVLNHRKLGSTVSDLYPSLKHIRNRPLFDGGPRNSGAAFTMIHRRVGFPENRAWKGVPSKPDFKLFFSPDVAMANELCSTGDAQPTDFKFFRWSTIWPPGQLEAECKAGRWEVFDAPVELLFADDPGEGELSLYATVKHALRNE